jgi:heme exporter protein C
MGTPRTDGLRWEHGMVGLGLVLLAVGHVMGLFFAPAEAMMGDVGRILYVHVPTAWADMLLYTACFGFAVATLWTGKATYDAAVEASAEVGVLYNALLLFQGSVWARPTWGVYWTWDPRLTTSAVVLVLFLGVLVLRKVIVEPERRLNLSSIAAVLAYVGVPIVYFSVKWWRTLHQPFSSPQTVDGSFITPLRVAAFGMIFLGFGLVGLRWRALRRVLTRDLAAPALPEAAPRLQLPGVAGASEPTAAQPPRGVL